MGRRIRRTLPGTQFETFGYDDTGNVLTKVDFNGDSTTFTYEPLTDRLSTKAIPGQTYTFAYLPTGRRRQFTDATGTTTFNFDSRNRVKRKVSPFGTLEYDYDAAGNLSGVNSLNANGVDVTYTYDTLNRLETVTDNRRGTTSTYTYDNVGNLNTLTYPNGIKHDWDYDDQNRLELLGITKGASAVRSYDYTLGAAGNRTKVVESSGRTVDWTYDDLFRLTNETITNDPATVNGSIGYTYDAVGNRLTRTSTVSGISNQNFTSDYDSNDRLNASGFSYDANGSTTQQSGFTYTFDADNRLKTATALSQNLSYVYDPDGNRVAKTNNITGITTNFLVDTNNLTGFAQVLEEIESGAVKNRYVYGLDLISQDIDSGSGFTQFFYGYDGQGSTRFLTDSSGTVTDTTDYDAFGTTINQTGSSSNNYLYTGEQLDSNLGFYYLRARYMNPAIGRFGTIDPLDSNNSRPDTAHHYVYATNDILNKVDPSGLFYISTSISSVGLLGSLSSQPRVLWLTKDAGRGRVGRVEIRTRLLNVPIPPLKYLRHAIVVFLDNKHNVELVLEGTSANTAKGFSDPTGLFLGFGNLLKRASITLPPGGKGFLTYQGINLHGRDEEAVDRLKQDFRNAFKRYKEDVPYATGPVQGKTGNSNSFAGSLVRISALDLFVGSPPLTLGWEIDVIR